MAKSIQRKIERSAEEIARLKSLRESFQRERPSIADLEAQGAEMTTMGEVMLLRRLADDLRKERESQGVSREQLAQGIGMNPESLAEIEAAKVSNLTLGVLSRIAHGLGKQISCSLVEKVA